LLLILTSPLRAQDHTVTFNTTDPGVTRSITNWGLDTGWPNYDNMYRGLLYMGSNTVNLVQVTFEMFAPVTNDITPQMKLDLTNMVNLASMTSTNARWILSSGTGGWGVGRGAVVLGESSGRGCSISDPRVEA
jgi:hypothetical protein